MTGLAKVGDRIEHGQPIPGNVVRMRDAQNTEGHAWVRVPESTTRWDYVFGSNPGKRQGALAERELMAAWFPMTVTEVDPEPQPAKPQVFEVPQPPPGVTRVTLVDPRTHALLYAAVAPDGDDWYIEDRATQPFTWVQLFVMAKDAKLTDATPPREPRTWEGLTGAPRDLDAFTGVSGTVYRRWAPNSAYYFPPPRDTRAMFRDARPLSHWREVDGPLTEVLS